MHFGVDYYPEHWPESRWETDATLMHEMRIEVVRLAEFAWHTLEPALGRFDFSWLDRALSVLAGPRHQGSPWDAFGRPAGVDHRGEP